MIFGLTESEFYRLLLAILACIAGSLSQYILHKRTSGQGPLKRLSVAERAFLGASMGFLIWCITDSGLTLPHAWLGFLCFNAGMVLEKAFGVLKNEGLIALLGVLRK